MRLYSGSSFQFIEDTSLNRISGKLENAFFSHFHYRPPESEIRSWRNSLRAAASVVERAELSEHGVILEYKLPGNSKRLDLLLTGRDHSGNESAVIVELKQWSKAEPSNGKNEVATYIGGGVRDVLHPSAQVGQYRLYLADNHTAFYKGDSPIQLSSCSYLHNYPFDSADPIFAPKFSSLLDESPIFTMDDVLPFVDHLQESLGGGEGLDVLRRVEEGEYRPSKKLMKHVGDIIKGEDRYILLDEQLIAYDKIFSAARTGFHETGTQVLIIKGGPGTGKSAIAMNVMADLLFEGYNTHYVTGSKAFTSTLREVIGRRGEIQFKYFNQYMQAPENVVDVMICDEAHRIRKTSNHRFMKKEDRTDLAQITELLSAGKVVVFFLDDDQAVRPNEVGTVDYIRENAEALDCRIEEMELRAQFRCGGAKGYVNWIDNTLRVKDTANVLLSTEDEFDFRIFDSPTSLEEAIRSKAAEGFDARMTAGFCWPWAKETNDDGSLPKDVVIGDFKRPWNARPEITGLAKGIPKAPLWAYDPNGIDQVGCIYTAQGFEFDYVGVIFGDDLVYDMEQQEWVGQKGNSEDWVVKRSGDKFIDLVKNTYRVLLTRGLRGCYVHFLDKGTEQFFRSRMKNEAAR